MWKCFQVLSTVFFLSWIVASSSFFTVTCFQVVVDCTILKEFEYCQTTSTLHQWHINNRYYSLDFLSEGDGAAFAHGMLHKAEVSTVVEQVYFMLPHVKLMMPVLKEERRCVDVNGHMKNLVSSFRH
jgi:hypothetical protein